MINKWQVHDIVNLSLFLYHFSKKGRDFVMESYIDRLMMCGYNAVQAYNIVRDFQHERDFEGLENFTRLMESDKKCRQCPFGKSLTIILLAEEESGIVPSER
jgi:hypothetical protein